MKLNASIIGGSSIVVLMLFAGLALGFTGQDFGSAAQAELSASKRSMQNARGFSCRQIGKLADKCFAGFPNGDCQPLEEASIWHFGVFGVDAIEDCKMPAPPQNHETLPAVPDDKLVFPTADVWKL